MKVFVTRPLAQAAPLAAAVRAAGFEPALCPLLAIAPVADPAPLDAALAALESYQLVVFVSPNAIEHALARLARPWPATVAIGVMGPGSRASLQAQGIGAPAVTVHVPQGSGPGARYDSEALFALLDPTRLAGSRVLIIKGNGGRPWLAGRLAAAGAQVDLVESYRREQPRPDATQAADLSQLVARGERAVWIVTSSEGLGNLVALLAASAGPAGSAWLRSCPLLVPHARIAENATAAGMQHVLLTGPGDENIVRTLKSATF